MTKATKIGVLGSLVAVVIGLVGFVMLGGNTSPGKFAVATAGKLVTASQLRPSLLPPAATNERKTGISAASTAPLPLPPQNVPIAPYLESLKQRAKAGDVRAACRVTFELARCGMRSSIRELARDVAGASLPDQEKRSHAKQINEMEDQVLANAGVCEGVADVAPGDLWEYALIAGYGGNVRTMVHFAAAPPGLDSRNLLAQLEGWTAWRDNAAVFVTRAVEAGDPAAIELAGHMHMVPRMGYQVLPLDPVRGLAHYYALQGFATPGYSKTLDKNIEYASQNFKLTEAQREEAKALSKEIAAKIARSGRAVDGVDFRRGSGSFKDALHCE